MTKTTDGKPRWGGPGCDALPFVPSNWGPAESAKVLASSPESCAKSIELLAEQQNVSALSQLLPSLLSAKQALESCWSRIVYSTSHMLVDGGGHDAFAKSWHAQTGHTPALAYQYALSEWRAVASTRPQIEVQRFIGAACIAGNIFEQYGGASSGVEKDLCWYLLANSTPHRVQVLEEILRHKHPERLPDAVLDVESKDLVCIADRLMLKQPI